MRLWLHFLGMIGLLILTFSEPAVAYPTSDTIVCRVTYENNADGHSQITSDEVAVKLSGIATLPANPNPKKFNAGSLGTPDFAGSMRDETGSGSIIYEGQFKAVVAEELYLPKGKPTALRPKVWLPAINDDGSPEIYMNLDESPLRAVWLAAPIFDNKTPLFSTRYFAVWVQLYDYATRPVSCRFTGTRTIEGKSFFSQSSRQNLADTEIKFVGAPICKVAVYPAAAAMHF